MSERPTWAERKAANNDGMDPDWRPTFDPPTPTPPPPVFIEKEHYDALKKELHESDKKRYALQFEIDTRWKPALKKANAERDQFQHEMMERHEKVVAALSKAKELQKENERLRTDQDEHMKLIDELRGCLAKRVKKDLLPPDVVLLKVLAGLSDSRNLTIGADGTTLKCTCERKPCHELHLSAGDMVLVVSYDKARDFQEAVKILRKDTL